MKRLLARLAPTALMGFGFYVYSDHFDYGGLNRALAWRQHTYEARSLAEQIARDAGCLPAPGKLPADLDAFADSTADNVAQVVRVAEMRVALARGDARRVSALADDAIAEENRLLPMRAAMADAKLVEVRRLAAKVILLAIVISIIQALVEFFWRATEPVHVVPPPPVPPLGYRPGGRP
jgi:hypothetical protein